MSIVVRIKQKPIKPVRKKNQKTFYQRGIYNVKLPEVIKWAEDNGYDISDVVIEQSDYDYDEVDIYALGLEPQASFDARMRDYKEAKAKYDEWYAENKTIVDLELKRREQAKLAKKVKTRKAKIKAIDNDIAVLQAKKQKLQLDG